MSIELLHGECENFLPLFEDNFVDALVTDPPAGIGFMGKDWDGDKGGRLEWVAWMSSVMRETMRVLKPGAHGLVWALPRTSHWTACALEDAGFEIRDCIYHVFGSGFPKSLNVSKAIDKAAGQVRPRVPGGQGGANKVLGARKVGEAISGEAQLWQGWGTALKPAVECWWLVRKPLSEKTVAANVLKWGTGALNIDASRIEGLAAVPFGRQTGEGISANGNGATHGEMQRTEFKPHTQGRFPAHLVLSHDADCTDDACTLFCAVRAMDEQTKNTRAGKPAKGGSCPSKRSPSPGQPHSGSKAIENFDDGEVTGASRFFYCAKVSPSERGEDNKHPTVKAQKLMRYLCRLITPPGGVVLDPFMGSGSTGLAAKSEGFRFVGIEQHNEYFAIAKRRIR